MYSSRNNFFPSHIDIFCVPYIGNASWQCLKIGIDCLKLMKPRKRNFKKIKNKKRGGMDMYIDTLNIYFPNYYKKSHVRTI